MLTIGGADRGKFHLVFPPNPGSGGETAAIIVAILAQIRKIRAAQNTTENESYHATVEAMKFAFAHRTELNDGFNENSATDLIVS